MITRVAEEANAVVPIVSFKEIAKQDWRRLPRIISSGLQTRASMVICTHFDQVGVSSLVVMGTFPTKHIADIEEQSGRTARQCC